MATEQSGRAANANREHFTSLVNELRELEDRLRLGGGPEKIDRQHAEHRADDQQTGQREHRLQFSGCPHRRFPK